MRVDALAPNTRVPRRCLSWIKKEGQSNYCKVKLLVANQPVHRREPEIFLRLIFPHFEEGTTEKSPAS